MVLDFESVTKQSNIQSFSHLLLKQVKDLIFEISISGSFFSQKNKRFGLLYYILVPFPCGGCVDEVVDKLSSYQENRYDVHFLECHTFAVIHFMNGEKVCWISKELFLM